MRKASLGASAGGGNPESGNSPVQIDEQKLAEKIRGLLMHDLNKQNQLLLEQQKEELQLSLLTRLQIEAESLMRQFQPGMRMRMF